MIKITALNDIHESNSDDDSETLPEASQALLEQLARNHYEKALALHSTGNVEDAARLYKDLLDTELLCDVERPVLKEKPSTQLWYLKYLCYKNLAAVLSSTGKLDDAIEAYSAACALDDTDVSLWHGFGQVCMQAKRFEIALYAFERGVECNSRHWPCLDSLVTLLLAFEDYDQCIVTIHEALKLDPGYLKGLVYRRHIFTVHRHMREYMEYLNPVYKWTGEDEFIDEERAKMLLKEAEVIHYDYLQQQQVRKSVNIVSNMTLKKPISRLTWESVGDSLIHMHQYMTEHCISHACPIKIIFDDPLLEMEVCEYKNEIEMKPVVDGDLEKTIVSAPEVIKAGKSGNIDSPKTESSPASRNRELKSLKKWYWSTNRPSSRSKACQKKYKIYDTLRALSKIIIDFDIDNILEDLQDDEDYFGTETENNDVREFIKKYTENIKDVIDLLSDYLNILACKWKKKWPEGLSKIFIEANACYSTHIDIPAFVNDNKQELLHYIRVNLLSEELSVWQNLKDESTELIVKLGVVDSIELILNINPDIFAINEGMEFVQRLLRLKSLIHIINKAEDLALESLHQLHYEIMCKDY